MLDWLPLPFNELTLRQLQILFYGSLFAGGSWLSRTLSGGEPMTLRLVIGGATGAMFSMFSFGALALSFTRPPDILILGAGPILGVLGGDALNRMAKLLEHKTGIPITGKNDTNGGDNNREL